MMPSFDIQKILENEESLDLVAGENLFIAREPTKPDKCVTIYDPPGGAVDITSDINRDGAYVRNEIQVRVRDVDYEEASTRAHAIMNFLHGKSNFEFNGTYYAFLRCTTPPTTLGWDDNNRVLLIINFQIQKRR